jgi:acyl-CoA synthetase (NDP forming)
MVFNTILKPKTLAVIGVSMANDRHPANVIYTKNLLRYPVDVYAVNPKGGSLQGQQVYKSMAEVPVKVDLAVIAVRAEHVPATMAECIGAGVGGAVVISGGFAEIGKNDLQNDLLQLAAKANFPFVGPNCLGVYSPGKVDTFFLPSERMVQPARGDVAIISQSGGILVDLMVKFAEEGIGVSHALSIGNKAQIREVQLLKHFAKDPSTRVIAFYVEGFAEKEGREFVIAAQKCPKPVIVLKAGKSAGGSRAVSSHTASLAGDYSVFSDVLEQFGVIEARNEFEMVSFCEALSCYQKSIKGNIGIVSGSGGHGALAVDVCSARGLSVPDFSQTVQDDLRTRLSTSVQSIAAVGNPIDLTGSAIEDDFVVTAEALSRIPEIDCILLLLLPYLPGISSDLGARLSQVYRQEGKPLVAYVPHVEKYRMLTEGFELNKVPVASSIEGAVLMAEALQRNKKA